MANSVDPAQMPCSVVPSLFAKAYLSEYLGLLWYALKKKKNDDLDPVVQSVVSLTSSLRVILLTVLADSIYNILIFFAEKMWVAFALQKLLTFFQQKISAYLRITRCKFCLFVLRFYDPVNPMGSCRARSVYLTTRLLGRLSPLSG